MPPVVELKATRRGLGVDLDVRSIPSEPFELVIRGSIVWRRPFPWRLNASGDDSSPATGDRAAVEAWIAAHKRQSLSWPGFPSGRAKAADGSENSSEL